MKTDNNSEASYINLHIRNELKYLLCGAKVWQLIEKKKIEDNMFLQVYAMTSCFVHIRNLYIYLTPQKKQKGTSILNSYNINPQLPKSELFAADKKTIEAKVMHLNPAKERESEKSINKKIVEYTEDILRIIADHLDNLKDINSGIYKTLLKVIEECYAEANKVCPEITNTNIFMQHVFENRIAKHLS